MINRGITTMRSQSIPTSIKPITAAIYSNSHLIRCGVRFRRLWSTQSETRYPRPHTNGFTAVKEPPSQINPLEYRNQLRQHMRHHQMKFDLNRTHAVSSCLVVGCFLLEGHHVFLPAIVPLVFSTITGYHWVRWNQIHAKIQHYDTGTTKISPPGHPIHESSKN